MAEQIPFSIIAAALTKLGSSAFEAIGSAFGVEKELRKLKEKLETIRGVVVDAEEKQVKSHAVKEWVKRLKGVVYGADDLLDEFETLNLLQQPRGGGGRRQVSRFFSSSNQLLLPFKMSVRVNKIKQEVDEIVKEIPLLNLLQLGNNLTDQSVVENSWRETHSFVLTYEIVGREEDKKEIINSLVASSDHEQEILSIVAIVGIGGLDKTTLAQLVFNDEKVMHYFQPRIWVCVSDPFDLKLLVKKILKEVVCDMDLEKLELNGLKNLLHEKISQKRCLLVLDDVWNEDSEKWDQLRTLLMVVGKGSKILVTTRHTKVASIMGIHSPFVLKGLKGNQPWDLFAKIAFKQEPDKVHPKFVKIGKDIVEKCNGVPLVIKTLGTMLRSKTEEHQWLSIKNNENLLSLGDGNDNVLSVLKLSYDNLPVQLKQCFGYCAIFPKDYEIKKRTLVQMWMAQGYIQPLHERIAEQYFDELVSRSLLEAGERDADDNILSCRMHDLIHDLAISVVGSEVLILEDGMDKISREVRHLSLFSSKSLELALKFKAKNIRTLNLCISGQNYSIEPTQSFSNLKCLRVLSLKGFYIEHESRCFDKLSHLRYLDLSYSNVEVLPNSITRLKNLQTIRLVGCSSLRELPKDTRGLINLRHLENDGCWRLTMPGGIGELTMLQTLPLFVLGNGTSSAGRLSELTGLNNLRGELRIHILENERDVVVESKEAILGGKQHIRLLRLSWSSDKRGDELYEEDELLIEGMQPHPNLERLEIIRYRGGRLPSWMMKGGLSGMLPNLTRVDFYGCSKCQTLPCFALLPHLNSLKLHDLAMVEYMEEYYCSFEAPFFPSLQELTLHRMPELKKELWKMESALAPPSIFLCLRELTVNECDELPSLDLPPSPLFSKLSIDHCTKLTTIHLPPSPILSEVEVCDCSNLTTILLPPSPPILSEVDISFCLNLTALHLPPSPVLKIGYCDQLASLSLEPHSSPVLSKLEISYCHKLTTILLPPSHPILSEVDISFCSNLTALHLPPSPVLKIRYCRQLASLSLEPHSSPVLSKLEISSCPKLTTIHLPPSSVLKITNCRQLASLSLEPHSSPILSELEISNCRKLTTLPVSSLSCLKKLRLDNVGEEIMRRSILSASSLKSVHISRIQDLISLPDELHLHASTLHALRVIGCYRLETLPDWIGNFSLLIDLQIRSCPNLTSLPEEMRSLTALKTLKIIDCGGLSERCQRENGEDWPKIAHVPRTTFVDDDIQRMIQMIQSSDETQDI